ncbi:MAG: ABC transporter ATP-binding protein [Erythrobacter sp.]
MTDKIDSKGPFRLTQLRKINFLIAPFGRRKLAWVAILAVLQGAAQTAAVSAIMPFLAAATDAETFRAKYLEPLGIQFLLDLSSSGQLIVIGVFAVLAIALANLFSLYSLYVSQRYTRILGKNIRVKLLQRLSETQFEYFLNVNSGVLLKKANNDIRTLTNSVLTNLCLIVAAGTNIALLLAALIYANPLAAIGSAAVICTAYLILFLLMSKHRKHYSKSMKWITRRVTTQIQQFLGGIKQIQLADRSAVFIDDIERSSHTEALANVKYHLYQKAPKHIIEPVAIGTLVGVIIVFASMGEGLTEFLPSLGFIAICTYKIIPNVQQLFAAATVYSASQFAVDEIYDEMAGDNLVNSESSDNTATIKFDSTLSLDQVGFYYQETSEPAIRDASLTIPRNTSVAFVGTTGCGKSTLVDIILGMLVPTSGWVRVDGEALDNSNLKSWQSKVGYVPQDIYLIDGTIMDNVAFGVPEAEVDADRVWRACEMACIHTYIESLHEGMGTVVGERGTRLSGGQKQRLGLARALYDSPEVLVLDEATSALDSETESRVMEAIAGLSGSLTMILIAHRTSTITWCDQVVQMERGRVVSVSSRDEYSKSLEENQMGATVHGKRV